MERWTLTVRHGSQVERVRFAELPAALTALQSRVQALAPAAAREPLDLFRRRYEAGRQVAARAEVSGPRRLLPSVRGGVDLRGDGSAEAYTGQWRRSPVARRDGETAPAALRRVLGVRAQAR